MGKGNRNRQVRVSSDKASANPEVKLSKKQLLQREAKRKKIKKYVSLVAVIAIIIGVIGGVVACKSASVNFLNRVISGSSSKYDISNAMIAYYAHDEARNMEQYYYYNYGQQIDLTSDTYKQTFIDRAKSKLSQYVALASEAQELGYKLDAEDKKSIKEALDQLEVNAKAINQSVNNYLAGVYCQGVTEKTVRNCLELQALASKYYTDMVDKYDITDDQIKTYFDEHPESFLQVDYLSYSFEGAVSDDATDEQKKQELEKRKEEANKFLETVKKNEDGTYDAQSFRDAINKLERDEAIKKANEEAEKDEKKKAELDKTIATINETDYSKDHESLGYLFAKENDFATWAFADERKVGDVKVTDGSVGCTVSLLTKTEYFDDYALRDIRYILVGGPKAADDASEDDKKKAEDAREEAKKKAEQYLNEYKSGALTEDAFAELAKKYSTDESTKANGGLYEDVDKGITVDEFDAWVFDSQRKAGDCDIVLSEDYGYFLIYYKGANEKLKWQEDANNLIFNEKSEADIKALEAKHPLAWDTTKVAAVPYEYNSFLSASTSSTGATA